MEFDISLRQLQSCANPLLHMPSRASRSPYIPIARMSVPSIPLETQAVPEDQEQQFVHEVYNDIAPHFSSTRYKPWPIVEKFLLDQPDYSIGIDVGCGNGKYLGVNKKLYCLGTDRSDGLIECAQKVSDNKYDVGVADGLHLPHESDRFDFAILIAVIHHFANEERRIEAIKHILSKLRVGGRLLVYCWALEQEKSRRGYKEGDDQDILIPWVLQKNVNSKKKKGAQKDDIEELKFSEPETKYRYYHLYRKGELVENAERAGGKVVDHGYEKDNWWAIVESV